MRYAYCRKALICSATILACAAGLPGQLPCPQSGELRGWLPEGEVSAFFPDGAKIIQHATSGKRGACFQRSFELPSQPRRAVLAVTAWGIAAAHLNGTLVGEVNQPNVERVPVFTEVTAWLRPGANVLQLRTSGGNKVYAQLRIELADGAFMDVCTDATWQWRAAPATGWPRGPLPPDNWQPARVFDDYRGTAGKATTWNREFALMPRELLRQTMEHAADTLRTPQPGDESAAPSQFRGTYLKPEYAARYQGFLRLDPQTGQVVDATGKIKHLLFIVYNQKTAKDPFVLRFTEWDFDQLENDLALMEQAEVHLYLRFLGWGSLLDGRGHWKRCERQPAGTGLPHFDFNFQILDHFLDRCQAHGRYVVIEGDHHWSASWDMLPPPYHYRYYLYPEVAEVNALAHRKILARYAQRPCVAGYMIGEEDIQMDRDLDNGHLRQAFAEYLRQRYHTLDALKAAWGAGYDYTDRSLLRPTPRKLDAWNLPDFKEMVSSPAYPLVSSPWSDLSRWQDVPLPKWPLFRAATSPYAELASFPALNTFTPDDPVWIDYNAFREDVLYLAHVNRWASVVRPAAPNQWLFHCNAQDFTAHWMFPMCYRRAALDFDVIGTGSHDTGKDLGKCTPAYRMRKYFANVAAYRPYARAPGSRAVAIAAGEGEGGAHDNEQEILNYHRAQTFELLGHGGAFEQAYRWTHLSGAMASPEAQPHLSKALQWMGEFYRAVDGVPFSLHRPVDVLIVGNNNLARSNRGGRDIGNIMAVSDSLGQLNIEFDIAMDLDLAYGKQQRKIDIGSYRMILLPCIDSDYPEAVWQVLDAWLNDPAHRGRRALVLGFIGRRTPFLTPTKQFHPTLAKWLGFANHAGEVTLKNANALAWTPVAPEDTAQNITINFGNRDLSPVGTFRGGRPLLATADGEVVAATFAHAGNAIYAFGFPLGLAFDLPWGIPAPQTPYDTMGTVFEDLVTAVGIPRPVQSPRNLRVAISDDQSIIMIQERFGIATTDLCRLKAPAGTVYEGCETVPQADGSVLLRAELKPYEGLFLRRKTAH